MYKSKILLVTALIIFTNSSCKKSFFDINQNPNQVTGDKITSELILPSALHVAGMPVRQYAFLHRWMGYWSNNATFNLNEEEVAYNLTTGFASLNNIWAISYDALFDFYNTEQKATEEGADFYAGIAKVMKARLFQDLVDMFGNIPYSEAFQSAEIATPKYDKGEDIYKDLQVVLDAAIEIFKNKPVPGKASSIDIMFQGNTALWIKFANTIKLRLLIRQSEIPGFAPAAELAKIVANGGVLMSGQSADTNPGYQNSTNQQNPYYSSFGFTVSGTIATENLRANTFMLNLFKSTNDPRLSRVFRPADAPENASNPFVGVVYGAPSDANLSGQKTSYVGPGLAKSASMDQWSITSVESMFLYAEAVARGWLAGDEKIAYENAVRESFSWLGVPNALTAANTYMTDNATADWDNAGTTVAQKVRFIAGQKYIAMAGLNALEAWSDYRRLGVPVNVPLSVFPGRQGSGLPRRLLYPVTEYVYNTANAEGEGTINLFTSKIFWDRQ